MTWRLSAPVYLRGRDTAAAADWEGKHAKALVQPIFSLMCTIIFDIPAVTGRR